ncbi:transcriptional regulator FlhC, partial [Escherichia coli]|nr:transcriptional regulator FlhC [Escherichia coli]
LKSGQCTGVEAVIKAYRLYLEQCPDQSGIPPLLALTRAWTLVRFVDSGMLQLSGCNCCGGTFITHAHQPRNSFVCSLCQPPSRAVKKRKLSPQSADITSQLLDEQVRRAV